MLASLQPLDSETFNLRQLLSEHYYHFFFRTCSERNNFVRKRKGSPKVVCPEIQTEKFIIKIENCFSGFSYIRCCVVWTKIKNNFFLYVDWLIEKNISKGPGFQWSRFFANEDSKPKKNIWSILFIQWDFEMVYRSWKKSLLCIVIILSKWIHSWDNIYIWNTNRKNANGKLKLQIYLINS